MKRTLSLISLLALTLFASAQTIYICKDGGYTVKEITPGLEINPAETDSVTFSFPCLPSPVVNINYNGGTATVTIPAGQPHITATVNGADVVINNTQTEGNEAIYVLSGNSGNGSFTVNGTYKHTIRLNGVNLTSQSGAPIDIQCGKRCAIELVEGTTNSIADAPGSLAKGALYCKGHIEFEGAGTLNVTGNANHAISAKEYTQLKRTTGTINILKAANDAVHTGQYFLMNGGTINIDSNTVGDGIQVEMTTDLEDIDNGLLVVNGGVINVSVASEDTKAMRADGDVAILGGTITLVAQGNGSRGIQADGNMRIAEAEGVTSITITASGAKCTQEECVDDPHKCTGIRIKGSLTVDSGTVKVYNTGRKAKGIKVDGNYFNNGGNVTASIEALNVTI